MATKFTYLFLLTSLILGCKKDYEKNENAFSIVENQQIILNQDDIDFYDLSSHLIYLKDHKSFSETFENMESFKVYVNGEEIYQGINQPSYSSSYPSGVVAIPTQPSFYPDYIVPLRFYRSLDGQDKSDPRVDERIVNFFRKHKKLRYGLSSEIIEIERLSEQRIKLNFVLNNHDDHSYLYLDPDKMGMDLFNYYSNGLYFLDFGTNQYYHKIDKINPVDVPETWQSEWLSIIEPHSSKNYSIVYHFDQLPNGQLTAYFTFPGLSFQVSKQDLHQKNGQIWLGELYASREISLE